MIGASICKLISVASGTNYGPILLLKVLIFFELIYSPRGLGPIVDEVNYYHSTMFYRTRPQLLPVASKRHLILLSVVTTRSSISHVVEANLTQKYYNNTRLGAEERSDDGTSPSNRRSLRLEQSVV